MISSTKLPRLTKSNNNCKSVASTDISNNKEKIQKLINSNSTKKESVKNVGDIAVVNENIQSKVSNLARQTIGAKRVRTTESQENKQSNINDTKFKVPVSGPIKDFNFAQPGRTIFSSTVAMPGKPPVDKKSTVNPFSVTTVRGTQLNRGSIRQDSAESVNRHFVETIDIMSQSKEILRKQIDECSNDIDKFEELIKRIDSLMPKVVEDNFN